MIGNARAWGLVGGFVAPWRPLRRFYCWVDGALTWAYVMGMLRLRSWIAAELGE